MPGHEAVLYCSTAGSLDFFEELVDRSIKNSSSKDFVVQAAQYIKDHPEEQLFMQIKLREIVYRRVNEAKIMLLYVVHELVKLLATCDPVRLKQWHYTVDHVIHAIMCCDNKAWDNRVGKTIARWGELHIYEQHLADWNRLVNREVQPRKGPPRLPKKETSKMPYKVVPSQANDALLMDARDEDSDKLESWRFSSAIFIQRLGESLDLQQEVVLIALYYFNRVFDRGVLGFERFRVATAALFLASKAYNIRARLFRYIRAMYAILERPLLEGDEEVEDLERIYLLHYELQVIAALKYEVAVELPLNLLEDKSLKLVRGKKDSQTIVIEAAKATVMDLYCLSICQSYSASDLAEAAVSIACRQNNVEFDFEHALIRKVTADMIYRMLQQLEKWKSNQKIKFDQQICLKNRKHINTGSPGSNEDTAKSSTASTGRIDLYLHRIVLQDEPIKSSDSSRSRRYSRSRSRERSRRKKSRERKRNSPRRRSRSPRYSRRSRSPRRRRRSRSRSSSDHHRRRHRSRSPGRRRNRRSPSPFRGSRRSTSPKHRRRKRRR